MPLRLRIRLLPEVNRANLLRVGLTYLLQSYKIYSNVAICHKTENKLVC